MSTETIVQIPVVSLLFGAAFVSLGVVLASRVIAGRVKYDVDNGDGDIPDLAQRIRAHGNFTEQAPLALVILAFAEIAGAATWAVVGLGSALLLTRGLSALGLTLTREQNSLRKAGAGLTQVSLMAAVGVVLYTAVPRLIGIG